MVIVFFTTTSVAYEWPRYTWVFKHVGVVEYILVTGHIDWTVDIYNNWPGFFMLAALVSDFSQISPLAFAQWAEPSFAMLAAAAVMYAVSALTEDRRVVWIAVVLFTLGSWFGSNYYSPQALVTVLASLFLELSLRAFPVRDADRSLRLRAMTVRLLGSRSVARLPPIGSGPVSRSRPLVMVVATHCGRRLWSHIS